MDYKRKLINFRPLLFLACVFIIAILLSSICLKYSEELVLFLITIFIAILLVGTVIAIYHKKHLYYITLIISIVLVVFSVFSIFNLKEEYFNENFNGTAEFNGEIVEISHFEEYANQNYYSVVAKGIINGKENKILFNINTSYSLYVGNAVEFTAVLSKRSYYSEDNKINYNVLINKEYYYASSIKDFKYSDEHLTFVSNLKRKILINLKNFMPDNYGFSYALLTGDTAYVNSNVLEGFNYSGISHVFAVSGLHVGFLYLLLTKLLKVFKFRLKTNRIITLVILFAYVYFCGLPPSCMRAFIILTVIAITNIIGIKGDRLNFR